MRRFLFLALLLFSTLRATNFAQAQQAAPLPSQAFTLTAPAVDGRAHAEVKTDGKSNHGTFAVYGDPNSMIQLSSLAFSGDGSLLAAGATPGTIDLWDVVHRKRLQTYDGATVATLAQDGSILATGEIAIVETKTLKERCRVPWQNKTGGETISRMHLSPSANLLAVTANGLDILIFDTAGCKRIATLPNTRDGDFSPDGTQFIAANYQVLTVWQVDGWKLLHTFPAGPDYTTGIAVSPDGNSVLIAGPHYAKLVHISDGSVVTKLGDGWISAVAFVKNDIVMVRDHQRVGFWTVSGKLLCEDRKLESGDLALSADNSRFAVGAAHQRDVFVWEGSSLAQACGLTR